MTDPRPSEVQALAEKIWEAQREFNAAWEEAPVGDWGEFVASSLHARGVRVAPSPDAPGLREALDNASRWEEEARLQYQNVAYWRERAERAEAALPPRDALDVERPRYTAYVDGRMCHHCGLEPYRHECPVAAQSEETPDA